MADAHAKPHHDYHLVNPSPWPLVGAIFAFLTAVGLIMEKYRDNVRAASAALEKQNPDGERHPNGYKQLEMHVQKGLRQVDEILLIAPPEYKPPLQLVRTDLVTLDDELLRLLFPRKHENKPPAPAVPSAAFLDSAGQL